MQIDATESLPTPLPRMETYRNTMLVLWLLAALCYAGSRVSGIDHARLGLVSIEPIPFVLWTVAAMLVAGLIVLAFKGAGMRETAIMREILPVTQAEKIVFCGVSISAGVCEEIIFRGFLLNAISRASGSLVAGVVLSSLVFGILHAHQNVGGATRAAILGAALCAPLLITGSIYPSMTAHALIDIVGGLWLGKWLVR